MMAHKDLMNLIVSVSSRIRAKHPELYANLDEMPLVSQQGEISKADLEEYLDSLKRQLVTFQAP